VLDDVIASTQNEFILGRFITNNAIIGYECIHALKHRKNGKKKCFFRLKLDMLKVYDRVEWPYLEDMVIHMGFLISFVELVMDCITTVSVLINGKPMGMIHPTRGIHQGDPISPYLFIICVEGLSQLISEANNRGTIGGFHCSKESPTIMHLFFANDSLLFARASLKDCETLQNILLTFGKASGQEVNFAKLALCCSRKVSITIAKNLASFLGVQLVPRHERYLGIPCAISRSKSKTFSNIIDIIWNKLKGWKSRLFSVGGKEILLKVMIQSIPLYTMNLFRLRAGLIEAIHKQCNRFWWGDGDTKKIYTSVLGKPCVVSKRRDG